MRLSLLTDKKNRIVKKYINKELEIQGGGHLSDGTGQTLDIPLSELPNVIRGMNQKQCLSLGYIPEADSTEYEIKSKWKAGEFDPQRSKEWFSPGEGILFDFDGFTGTMQDGVELLCDIDPALNKAALLGIPSSSGMLFDIETNKLLSKKSNFHIYMEGNDGDLVREYCDIIYNRMILKGLGKVTVFKNTGAKRIKTIVDETVWSASNREIFEANPECCEGVESRRLNYIEYEEGNVLDVSKSIELLRLSPEEEVRLELIKSKLKSQEDVVKQSEVQKKIGRNLRAKKRAEHTKRKVKIESKRTVSAEEWEDVNGVLHCYLGANDYIMDSKGIETKISTLLNDPDAWDNKPLPDPIDPYKRGDEARGIVGQGIAYVRVNEDSMHIFSFWGDIEYHLIWDLDSILTEIEEWKEDRNQDELDEFINLVFSETSVNHKLSSTEMNTVGKAVADANKHINSNSSQYGIDARAVPAELKKKTGNRDINDTEVRSSTVHEDHITKLNSKYGVCLIGGKARMVEEIFNPELHEWSPEFVALCEQKIILKNQRIIKTVAGKAKSTGIIDDWELHPKRNSYDRVVFQPKNDLFRGCGCKPVIKQGGEYNQWMGFLANLDNAKRCKKILWHIRYVWCGGSTDIYLYTLKWLSKLFQQPWKVGAPYLVLKSKQGAGKNIVIDNVICRLLGAHAISTSNKEDLLGRFNSHLGINVLLFLDEAIFAGDPRSKNLMKSLVNEFRMVEQKGINKEKGKNYTKILMATNEEHAANIEFTDRRHVYLPMSDEMKGNTQYFKDLAMEIDNGGREAFLDFMLKHKSSVDLNVMPKGQSEQRQKDMLKSERPAIRFIHELVEHGPEQFASIDNSILEDFEDWDKKNVVISKSQLFNMFCMYCKKSGIKLVHMDITEFMRELSSRGIYAGDKKIRARKKEEKSLQDSGAESWIVKPPKEEFCRIVGADKKVLFYVNENLNEEE